MNKNEMSVIIETLFAIYLFYSITIGGHKVDKLRYLEINKLQ